MQFPRHNVRHSYLQMPNLHKLETEQILLKFYANCLQFK